MLKLLIICCVATWVIGLFMGRKRRIIKNSTHLTQLLIWLMLIFMASAYVSKAAYFDDNLLARAVALLLWFAASYKLSFWIASLLDRKS